MTASGTEVELTANEDGSYSFTMPAEAVTVTANITLSTTYSITVGESENGSMTVNNGYTEGYEGQNIKLTVTPDTGYVFLYLLYQEEGAEAVETTATSFLMPDKAVTITAVFGKVPMVLSTDNSDSALSLSLMGQAIPTEEEGTLYTENGVVTVDVSNVEPTASILDVSLTNTTLASIATDAASNGGMKIITALGTLSFTQEQVNDLYQAAGTNGVKLVLSALGEVDASSYSSNSLTGTADGYRLAVYNTSGAEIKVNGLSVTVTLPVATSEDIWQAGGTAATMKLDVTADEESVTFETVYPAYYLMGTLSRAENIPAVSEDGYYEIYTADELTWTTINALYANIRLMADINVDEAESWSAYENFYGHFDGNGHTVSGTITVNDPNNGVEYGALFRKATNATIENLTVSGSITGDQGAAAIVAIASGCTIRNCTAGDVTLTLTLNHIFTGGLVGTIVKGDMPTVITGCSNTTLGCVGGLVGKIESGAVVTIENCYSSNGKLGGIVANCNGNLTITGCVSTADVTNLSYQGYLGGILGRCDSNAVVTITDCYNVGDRIGTAGPGRAGESAGGIVGLVYGTCTVTNCYNTGTIKSAGTGFESGTNLGQIVGTVEGKATVENCYYLEITPDGDGAVVYGEAKTADELKALTATLGEAWADDYTSNPINDGYPILSWQKTCRYENGFCIDCGECDPDADSYVIYTAEQLLAVANMVNAGDTLQGKTVTLANDIDLFTVCGEEIGSWEPIGGAIEEIPLEVTSQEHLDELLETYILIYDTDGVAYKKGAGADKQKPWSADASYYYISGKIFSGTFDGNGKTISNLYINTDECYLGLFGNVNGTVKNLTLNGSVTCTGTQTDYVGSVAGLLSEYGVVERCVSYVTINALDIYNVGGIVGCVGTKGLLDSQDNTFVLECVNFGAVTAYSQVGGIAGHNAGQIQRCANYGTIQAVKSGTKGGAGGIVGRNGENNAPTDKGTIIDCYNAGTVGLAGRKWQGGIVGFANANSVIKNCYNVGTVVAGAGQTNALIGQNEGYIENSWCLDTTVVQDANGVYDAGGSSVNCGALTEAEMKAAAFAAILGDSYKVDNGNSLIGDRNGGYPVLAWMGGEEAPTLYTVTLPDSDETFVITTSDSTTVAEGGSFSFKVYIENAPSGFIPYLLGITRVNPLPSELGGHNLVWQEYVSYGREPSYVLHLSADLEPQITAWLENHWLKKLKSNQWTAAQPYEDHLVRGNMHFLFDLDAKQNQEVEETPSLCREDIYFYLKKHGFVDKDAFRGMRSVQKGRGFPVITDEMSTADDNWILKQCEDVNWLPSRANLLEQQYYIANMRK